MSENRSPEQEGITTSGVKLRQIIRYRARTAALNKKGLRPLSSEIAHARFGENRSPEQEGITTARGAGASGAGQGENRSPEQEGITTSVSLNLSESRPREPQP